MNNNKLKEFTQKIFDNMAGAMSAGLCYVGIGLGLGTCMGPMKTEKIVRDSGYSHFETLDIKSKVNLFYVAKV